MTLQEAPTTWTNRSVLRFIGQGSDPIEKVIGAARALVLKAADSGWSGPAFDPVILCKHLNIEAVPKQDIDDARTVPMGTAGVRIEFNPLRPKGRVRFSIAHEIAHTLFPDCAEQIRHRVSRDKMRGDEWQLELLCNIAAAEIILPAGHFADLKNQALDVNHLMQLRREYDVSTEAMFLRVIKLTETDATMFVASKDEGSLGKYSIDYIMPGRNSTLRPPRGLELPTETVAAECTAIGFTAKGREKWSAAGDVHVECAGIPPYPGRSLPRVVGIVRPSAKSPTQDASIKYVHGDALKPRNAGNKLVVHIVNDKTPNWGGGFALQLRKQFASVQEDFQHWALSSKANLSLGNVRFANAAADLAVASMVAQHGYGPSSGPRIRYEALVSCLEQVAQYAAKHSSSVHMPRIGCGNAGGTWEIVGTLLDEVISSKRIAVTVYDPPGAPKAIRGLFTSDK